MSPGGRSTPGGSVPNPNDVQLLRPGTRFRNQPWIIEEQIGSGASGHVYRILHDQLGHFALKTSMVQVSGRTQEIRRALAGSKANYLLEHVNIVRVFDLNWEDDGLLWVRMELLQGQTVAELLRQVGPFPILSAFDVALETAAALQAVHEHKIIHRDVKPSNLMLTTDGFVKLFDFAYAKVSNSGVKTTQGAGALLGSLPYMAPEQHAAAPATPQFDVYSLGVTLWELLVGVHPLAPYAHDLQRAISTKLTSPLPSLVATAGLPGYVDAFVQRATARNPAHRHASVWEFLQEGDRVREQLTLDADPRVRSIVTRIPHWAQKRPVRRQLHAWSEYAAPASLRDAPAASVPSKRVIVREGQAGASPGRTAPSSTPAAAPPPAQLHPQLPASLAATEVLPAARDAVAPPPPDHGAAPRRSNEGPAARSPPEGTSRSVSVARPREDLRSGPTTPSLVGRTTDEPLTQGSQPPPGASSAGQGRPVARLVGAAVLGAVVLAASVTAITRGVVRTPTSASSAAPLAPDTPGPPTGSAPASASPGAPGASGAPAPQAVATASPSSSVASPSTAAATGGASASLAPPPRRPLSPSPTPPTRRPRPDPAPLPTSGRLFGVEN